MKITIEERNVMTLINISRIIADSLKYVDNPANPNFSLKEKDEYKKALDNLTKKNSPFEVNCSNNGEFGSELYQDMEYFISDVYDRDGRIVSTDINDNVVVEKSLVKELYNTICKLRIRIEAIIDKGIELLRNNNNLDKEVEDLYRLDKLFFHSYASKIGSELLVTTFDDLNQASRIHQQNYSRTHNGIDPFTDPNFDQDADASVRMLVNEFKEINTILVATMNLETTNHEYKHAREQVISDLDVFSGKKVPTNFNSFAQVFISYFDKVIPPTVNELNKLYNIVGDALAEFDEKMIKELEKKEK